MPNTLSFELRRLNHQVRLVKKWWLKPHKTFQPFFVIATCRSGSNLLLSYLRQHDLSMLGEVLCHVLPTGPRNLEIAPTNAIRHIRYSFQTEKAAIRGCKLMLYQLAGARLTMDGLDAAFPDAKYVILYRENLAEQYISQKKADRTNQFLLRPGQDKKDARVHVDPIELQQYCDKTRRGYEEVLNHAWLRDRAVLTSYEELIAEPSGCLRNYICPLLRVAPVPAKTDLQKQNDKPLEASIVNYSEVATLLSKCRQHHAWPAEPQRASPYGGGIRGGDARPGWRRPVQSQPYPTNLTTASY